jgi:ADP-ribose pyrophosphatase
MMNTKINPQSKTRFKHNFSLDDVTIHSVETRFQGFFKIDCYQLSHKLFNGEQSDILRREIFERGDAVVLMPYDAKLDKVILIEQFRPGAIREGETPWLLEFVAGMFNANENPEDAAIREAEEEAGLIIPPDELISILSYFSSPGGMSEKIHLYAACIDSSELNNDNVVFGLEDEGEDILVHTVSRNEAMALLSQGKINNAATIIGLQWLALNYQALQAKASSGGC